MSITYAEIKHPQIRLLLLEALDDLAHKEIQLSQWVSDKSPYSFWGWMKLPIAVIFDDLGLDDETPENQIGYSLRNHEELHALKPLIAALNRVIDEVGIEQPDQAYINSPLWDEVVRSAQAAYKVLSAEPVIDPSVNH